MLQSLRVLKIDSDLSDPKLSSKTAVRAGFSYDAVVESTAVRVRSTLIFEYFQKVDEDSVEFDDSNKITESVVEGEFLYQVDKEQAAVLGGDDKALQSYLDEQANEIYVHLYNRAYQMFTVHGVGSPSMPIPAAYPGLEPES